MKTKLTHLSLTWSISKGRDTYGWNICRIDDSLNGKRYKCMGGGYDMHGTVFGSWLQATHQNQLRLIAHRAPRIWFEDTKVYQDNPNKPTLYGMTAYYDKGELASVHLDGACGLESMITIAEAMGLTVQRIYGSGRNQRLIGFIVSEQEKTQ